jgi:outer membrane protein insertion porin family
MIKIMFKILFSSLLLLSVIAQSFAEEVKIIKVKGNNRVSDQTIILFSEIIVGDNLTQEGLNLVTKNLYSTNFFKDISLSLSKNILIIGVMENPIVQSIQIDGVKLEKYTEPLLEIILMKEKSSYVKEDLDRDFNKIKSFLKYSGYYFSEVDVDIKENENNTVDIIYNISMGEKAKIKQIKFTGNKIYKDKKLKNIIVTEESKFWKFLSNKKYLNEKQIDLDTRLLKNFYLNKGYFNVKIDSSSANYVEDNFFDLVFNINSGNKFYFNNFDLMIPNDFSRDNFRLIENQFTELKDKPYSFNAIKKILDEVDAIALSKQYEFINATIEEKIVDGNKINFKILIDESEKFYVNRVNIFGNDITNEKAIRDLLVIDEGDPLNKILNKRSINNIKASGLFSKVDYKVSNDDVNTKKNIDITVEEQPTGEISAGAGYGSTGQTFTLGIRENNFNGNNVKVNTNLTLAKTAIEGGISFSIPNFRYSDNSLNLDATRRDTDLLSTNGYKNKLTSFTLGTGFEQKQNFYISPSFNIEYEKLETTKNASKKLKAQEGSYFDLNLDYGLLYDKRDQTYATTDGFYSRFNQVVPIISDNWALLNTYDFKTYYQLSDRMISSVSFYAAAINSLGGDDVIVSDRVNLPSKRLRGFKKGRIGPRDTGEFIGGNYASAVTLGTTLPNLLPELQFMDFNLFLDFGNVWGVDYDESLDKSKIRSSTGLAINMSTPIGPINFVLAQPITKDSGDTTESFRFDIGTTF